MIYYNIHVPLYCATCLSCQKNIPTHYICTFYFRSNGGYQNPLMQTAGLETSELHLYIYIYKYATAPWPGAENSKPGYEDSYVSL